MSRQTINSIEKERYTPSLPLAIGDKPGEGLGGFAVIGFLRWRS